MDPFIGQIILFGGNFEPRGWAFCHGQLLPIAAYSALFSILGTTYGGDGESTFGLPDLRGRVPTGEGNGPGLSTVRLGQKGGVEHVTLTTNQMPSHSHTVNATSETGSVPTPKLGLPAGGGSYGQTPNTTMSSTMISNTGGGKSVSIVQPYLGLSYIIALEGLYPSRG